MITRPKCGCAAKSIWEDRVFTCPICIRAALQFWDGEGVDQYELFEYLDKESSVSALDEDEDTLTPIAEVLRSLAVLDDLPF